MAAKDEPVSADELAGLDAPARLGGFRGGVPDEDLDSALQAIVLESCELSEFPIALVSLALRGIQFFRAHVGLPEELEISRSTDRCVSFCQFVVTSGKPVAIPNISEIPCLPHELIETYGVQAYYGLPLRVDGQIVGALCVLDITPHRLDLEQLQGLRLLADRTQHRLLSLTSESTRLRRQLYKAVQPAFGELRNVLQILHWDLENARVAALEIGGLRLLLEAAAAGGLSRELLLRNAGVLKSAAVALDDLDELIGNLRSTGDRAGHIFSALETGLEERSRESVNLAQAIVAASGLAEHYTRSRGGLRWSEIPQSLQVKARPTELISLLALALRGMADRLQTPGLSGHVALEGERVTLTVLGDIDHDGMAVLGMEMVLVEAAGVTLALSEGQLHVSAAVYEP